MSTKPIKTKVRKASLTKVNLIPVVKALMPPMVITKRHTAGSKAEHTAVLSPVRALLDTSAELVTPVTDSA